MTNTPLASATTVQPINPTVQSKYSAQIGVLAGTQISGVVNDQNGNPIDLSAGTIGYTVECSRLIATNSGGSAVNDTNFANFFGTGSNWVFTGDANGKLTMQLKDSSSPSFVVGQFSGTLALKALDSAGGTSHLVYLGNVVVQSS
jgi:hypothetical protein